MIAEDSASLLTLREAAKLPILGKGVTHNTIRAWVQIGIRGHKLTVRRIGGRVYTTEGNVEEFLTAINTANGVMDDTKAGAQ